jgi:hypothetical protein
MTTDNVIQFPGGDVEAWHPGELVDEDPIPVFNVEATVLDRYVDGDLASRSELAEWFRQVGQGAHMQWWLFWYGLLRLPAELGRAVRDSPRGLAVVLAWWWRWVSGARQTPRLVLAISSADVADAYSDRKRDRMLGSILSVLFVLAVSVGSWWGWHHMPVRTVAAWLGVSVGLGLLARLQRGDPLLPPVHVPTGKAITAPAIVDAFAPLCGKDQAVTVLGTPHRKGDGWYAVVELPSSLEAATVVKRRATVAAGLKVAEDRVTVDPLPLASADQIGLYVADRHPLEVEVGTSPVLEVAETDVMQGIPLGGASAGTVALSIEKGAVLVSGTSGFGKTVILRNILNACLLDPATKPCIWDFKGDGDFTIYEDLVEVHEGDDDENVRAFAEWLKWQRGDEMPRRKAAIRAVVKAGDGDPKLTRPLALRIGLPFLPIFGDEIQVPLSWGGQLGKEIAENLLHMGRTGRSRGYRLILATQRPDSEAIDTALRAQLPTRISTYMDTADSSKAALGKSADSGWAADKLPEVPGVAIGLGPGIITGATRFKAFNSTVEDARLIVRRAQSFRTVQPDVTEVQSPRLQDRPALPEVLRVALAAWPNPGKDAHSDILAGEVGWDRGDLVAAMKAAGVEHRPVYQPRRDGQPTTARGFALADVEAARRSYGG